MPEWLKEAFNYGVPCVILFAVGIVIYRWVTAAGVIGKDAIIRHLKTQERYTKSTEDLHNTLQEQMAEQQQFSRQHADGLNKMVDATERTSETLTRLHQQHVSEDGKHSASRAIGDIVKLRRAAKRACDMVEFLSASAPEADKRIAEHIAAIRRELSSESDVKNV